jgi:prevent-host-death family protein
MIAFTIQEAESRLSELIAQVEESDESVFLTRLGRTVARIIPVRDAPPRDVSPDPSLAPIEIKGNLFGDDSADWESA